MEVADSSLTSPTYFVFCHMDPFIQTLLGSDSQRAHAPPIYTGLFAFLTNTFIMLKQGSVNYNTTINWQD